MLKNWSKAVLTALVSCVAGTSRAAVGSTSCDVTKVVKNGSTVAAGGVPLPPCRSGSAACRGSAGG